MPSSDKDSALASANHWDRLAAEALAAAEWDDLHVGSGAASRAKAETYKRTAESLRMEHRTGVPHCSCCLKPRGLPEPGSFVNGSVYRPRD